MFANQFDLVIGATPSISFQPKNVSSWSVMSRGVKSAHIIDGRAPHSLLLEILTDEGAGTMITG